MSEQKKQKGGGNPNQPSNVVQLPSKCKAEACGKKADRAEFCEEHFTWFKEGLLTKEGKKPIDFERKMYHFSKRAKVA